MARADATDQRKTFYRAVVELDYEGRINPPAKYIRYFGPYNTPAPAKAAITKEQQAADAHNLRIAAQDMQPVLPRYPIRLGPVTMTARVEKTDLNWQPV